MRTTPPRRFLAASCTFIAVCAFVGCGANKDEAKSPADQSLRAAALSLQQAMDSSARAIDGVRGTREALERFAASVQPAIAQTGDVIVLLTPQANGTGAESKLLNAAREQRSFLQFAVDSARTRSRRAANSALERAREAGRRTTTAYTAIAQESSVLAGLLPASTTFNTGRLRDAERAVTRRGQSAPPPPPNGGPPPPPIATGAACGDGVSVNGATSCPFGRNVASEFRSSDGASTIEVYSPVTKLTYTMSCSGGVPTVCRGGNNAVVYIR